VAAGAGIAKTVSSAGGDEQLTLSVDTTGANTGDLLTRTVGGVAFQPSIAVPVGGVIMWPSDTAPAKWLLCYGQLLSLTTYKALFDALRGGVGLADLGLDAGTAVTGDAATDNLLAVGHGLNNGDLILFSNSGGALPAPLAEGTVYHVRDRAPNDFKVALTAGGDAVDLTSAGTGTHKFHTQYANLDLRGRLVLGQDDMGGASANRVTATQADNVGQGSGAETHTLTEAEMPAHSHTQQWTDNTGTLQGAAYAKTSAGSSVATTNTGSYLSNSGGTRSAFTTQSVGSGEAHNNMPPYLTLNFMIYAGV